MEVVITAKRLYTQSPGSRSAPWGDKAPEIYPARVAQNWWPDLYNPCRVGIGGVWTQGALARPWAVSV